MFTTGSKLFIGATLLSAVGAIAWAIAIDGPAGMMGTVALISTALIFAFLTGINFFIRDGNIPSMEQGVQYTSAAAQPPVGRSMWPVVAAVGTAGLAVGAVSRPVVFKVAVVVLLAATVEWMVQAWSERASADATFNASIRRRMLNPLEFPILAAVGLGALVYGFSRLMLSATKSNGLVAFVVIGTLILGGAFVFAYKRGVGKATGIGILSLGAVTLVGVGVVSAVGGQRPIEEHHGLTPDICLETASEEVMAESDENNTVDVSAQSSVIANIELQDNGVVIAWVAGYEGDKQAQSTLIVPRSAEVRVLFHNNYQGEHRLTGRLGTFGEDPEIIECTTRAGEGDTQFLSFKIPKTNAASSTPLELVVPSVPGQTIQLVVP